MEVYLCRAHRAADRPRNKTEVTTLDAYGGVKIDTGSQIITGRMAPST